MVVDENDKTRFRASLHLLDQRTGYIPIGWQRLYGDLRASLRAIACAPRDAVAFGGGYEHDGQLHVEAVSDDKVVTGILRKARVTALCTCMSCGKHGKPREIGYRWYTLCAACAGGAFLRRDVLALLQSNDLSLEVAMKRSKLVAAAIQSSIETTTGASTVPSADLHDFVAWLDVLLDAVENTVSL